MELEDEFVANIRDVYGALADPWLEALPQKLRKLSEQWRFEFLRPIEHLSYSFVAQVKSVDDGREAVIKMVPDQAVLMREVSSLQSFTNAVPHIFAIDKEEGAVLLELLSPGDSLKNLVIENQDEKATRIICAVILQLQKNQKIVDYRFKHLTELAQDLKILEGRVECELVEKAKSYFRDLSADCSQDLLVHGDLHHDNILACGDSWKAIDPHGYIGDPAFEVGAMIRNPYDHEDFLQPNTIENRLAILCEELPFDPQRIKAWAFSATVLSLAWSYESHQEIPAFNLEIAHLINKSLS